MSRQRRRPPAPSSTRPRGHGWRRSAMARRTATPPSPASTTCCCGARGSRPAGAATQLRFLRPGELDDIAMEAADDALLAVLRAPRRLPRPQPVHDLGLQVRAARGGREAAQAQLAGPRGARRGRRLGGLPGRRRPGAGGRVERAAARRPADDRHRPDAPPAPRAGRAGAPGRADRRARRPALDHPRRALQDAARRPPAAPAGAGTRRATISTSAGRGHDRPPQRRAAAAAARDRPHPRSGARRASTSSTATWRWS